jgi:hypothetical protein
MKIAIMQPYFMPYIGYYQLINEVDMFIFYDDVNFIKGGWINRNYITINNQPSRFTIPLKKISSFKKINETFVDWDSKHMNKFIKTFNLYLKDKPNSKKVMDEIFEIKPKTISEMSILSIELSCKYLGINTIFKKSSDLDFIRVKDKTLNLINICKNQNQSNYVNMIGGEHLYSKDLFNQQGIFLSFMSSSPSLSMIEFLDNPNIKKKLNEYEII